MMEGEEPGCEVRKGDWGVWEEAGLEGVGGGPCGGNWPAGMNSNFHLG